ncbi:response regulator transcription factor [Rathayibacter sp. VKM Ac-2835]|uniref:response regulator n=1 Tax=Rathayibacter sp. VKM Ac-2835 TaxID=2739043 RepID=UPI0015674932|nr:response regulator transcription factor [Rathayibacter sp. VKM Ac-2835]NRG41062.1 response regulator transcription factor [Rathayibacter sp. VKM Ac-2835]
MIRVMIVDDQEMIRTGLRTIVDAQDGIEVAAEAADGFAALALLRTIDDVDVVLMDLRMPGIDGVETTRRIRAEFGVTPRILILTTFDQDENVLHAVRAGADGFFGKAVGPDELTAGIRAARDGRRALSQDAVDAVVSQVARAERAPEEDPEAVGLLSQLTPREKEVVELVVSGLDNSAIAQRLLLSPFTVKTHANRAMTKVGARDRAQLVTLAVQGGIRP